jgi:hypothetical protein
MRVGCDFQGLESQFSYTLGNVEHKERSDPSSPVPGIHEEILELSHSLLDEERGEADDRVALIGGETHTAFTDSGLWKGQPVGVLQEWAPIVLVRQ